MNLYKTIILAEFHKNLIPINFESVKKVLKNIQVLIQVQ